MATFVPAPNAPAAVRSGDRLFIAVPPAGQTAQLPPICIKCGQPASGKPLVKVFSWHHPALYLVILAGVLIYVIVAMIVRKTIRVAVPLCPHHRQRRSLWVTLAWVLPLVGIADAFILSRFDFDPGWIALITISLVLAGLIIWAAVANPMRPRSIDAYRAEFSGLCDAFLDQFPASSQL